MASVTLYRSYYRFDTGALTRPPSAATVQITTYSIADWGSDEFPDETTDPTHALTGQRILLTAFAPAGATPVSGDWAGLTGAALASDTSYALSGVGHSATLSFPLNAAGRAAVVQGGVTSFGLQISADLLNVAPSSMAAGKYIELSFYGRDDASLSGYVAPVLLVTA